MINPESANVQRIVLLLQNEVNRTQPSSLGGLGAFARKICILPSA
jgi:hypothetical protein